MAKNDITIVDNGIATPTRTYRVESGSAGSISPGEPVKVGGTGNNYVVLCATGDPEIGTDQFVGIAATTSTDTASADGTVEVYIPIPGQTVMRCAATTASNIDTDAKLLAILNDSVTFDLTSSTFTVDENEGDDPNVHGLVIVDGDINAGTLDFTVNAMATQSAPNVGQTRD